MQSNTAKAPSTPLPRPNRLIPQPPQQPKPKIQSSIKEQCEKEETNCAIISGRVNYII
jgi:hypothetical protein